MLCSKPSSPVGGKVSRLDWPDALRGLAVLLMMVFHSAYDLNHFSILSLDLLHSDFWPTFQKVIMTLFVGVAGVSLALASRHGLQWQRFWQREVILLASAALVSAGSYWLFPASWIFFGVLHFMALGSLLAVPLLRLGGWNVLLGVFLVALPGWFTSAFFNAAGLQWVGLGTVVTSTKDYAPLLPWFGVLLLGVAVGRYVEGCHLCQRPLPHWRVVRGLLWLGKHSLVVYLLHQPLLMGVFWLLAALMPDVAGT